MHVPTQRLGAVGGVSECGFTGRDDAVKDVSRDGEEE
jgi:hypothetical protein